MRQRGAESKKKIQKVSESAGKVKQTILPIEETSDIYDISENKLQESDTKLFGLSDSLTTNGLTLRQKLPSYEGDPFDDRETEGKSIIYLSGSSTPGRKRGRPRKNSYSEGYSARGASALMPIPNITEEGRESQLVAMAVDLAERQLIEGTASSQVITHFLKLGTQQAKLEREKLARENELLRAKTEALHSAKRVEELYEEALKAMRTYSGTKDDLV